MSKPQPLCCGFFLPEYPVIARPHGSAACVLFCQNHRAAQGRAERKEVRKRGEGKRRKNIPGGIRGRTFPAGQ